MPRKPSSEPSFHKASGWYVMYVRRKMVYLSKEYSDALKMMRERLLAEATNKPVPCPVRPVATQMSFAALAKEYMEDLKIRRPKGAQAQHERLVRAMPVIGAVPIAEMKRFHLGRVEQLLRSQTVKKPIFYRTTGEKVIKDTGKPYSPTTIRDTLEAVQAVFGWAVRNDLIDHNPLSGYPKPAGQGRFRLVTDAEFRALLRASNSSFRLLLFALRETGCRPCELRKLSWSQVDLERRLAVLRDHKTSRQTGRVKQIPLSEALVRRLQRIAQRNAVSSSPFVFLNTRGQPYTKDAAIQAFDDARTKAGIETKSGEKLVLYSNRHTFGTKAAKQLGILAAAKLLGHTTTAVTNRYIHLSTDDLIDLRARLETGSNSPRQPAEEKPSAQTPKPKPKRA